jgi:arylsulfatase
MGFGVVSEQSTGYPGNNSIMTRDKANIGRILTDHGYWTSWFGKDHNTPEFQASQAGPFDQLAHRHGLRLLLWFRGRRCQPVAAERVPQHHGHLPVLQQPGLEPDHGAGRRCYPISGSPTAINNEQPFFIY